MQLQERVAWGCNQVLQTQRQTNNPATPATASAAPR